MTPSQGQDWNEMHLSEDLAVELLQALVYTYVSAEILEAERDSLKESILASLIGRTSNRLPTPEDSNDVMLRSCTARTKECPARRLG